LSGCCRFSCSTFLFVSRQLRVRLSRFSSTSFFLPPRRRLSSATSTGSPYTSFALVRKGSTPRGTAPRTEFTPSRSPFCLARYERSWENPFPEPIQNVAASYTLPALFLTCPLRDLFLRHLAFSPPTVVLSEPLGIYLPAYPPYATLACCLVGIRLPPLHFFFSPDPSRAPASPLSFLPLYPCLSARLPLWLSLSS